MPLVVTPEQLSLKPLVQPAALDAKAWRELADGILYYGILGIGVFTPLVLGLLVTLFR